MFGENPFDKFPMIPKGFSWDVEGEIGSKNEWEVMESDENYIITLNVPGFNKDDITVRLSEDRDKLGVKAVKQKEQKNEVSKLVGKSRFSRTFKLPDYVDTENPEEIETDYNNGILTISIPLEEERNQKDNKEGIQIM